MIAIKIKNNSKLIETLQRCKHVRQIDDNTYIHIRFKYAFKSLFKLIFEYILYLPILIAASLLYEFVECIKEIPNYYNKCDISLRDLLPVVIYKIDNKED